MFPYFGKVAVLPLSAGLLLTALPVWAQAPKTSTVARTGGAALTAEKAMDMAEHGRCKESLMTLKHATSGASSAETRKKAGILALRCALAVDDRASASETLLALLKQFPEDPEILFVSVHAYSDLSSRTAVDLIRVAPQSFPAKKLNAEALEAQGKWDEAQKQYEEMLKADPTAKGVHYLYGRLLLSKPGGDAAAIAQAKAEFQKELEIDPNNAGAEYILGEMARQESQWDDAIVHFSRAAHLDAGFGDAFMGWGFCLVNARRYEEAIPPLQMAVRLQPDNPGAHYNLAVSFSRTGKKEEAQREFAIHQKLIEKSSQIQEKKE
jgi:tetratricopeptide (TPR) repeat protein